MRIAVAAGVVVGCLASGPARADTLDSPPLHELTLEAEALAVGATYAWRVGPTTLAGFGGAFGLSPWWGTILTSNDHYAARSGVALLQLLSVQVFARLEPASWLRFDLGGRAGAIVHGSENFTGGPFAMAFAAPAIGHDWFWIGPRIGAGALTEAGENASWALELNPVIARLSFNWW
jgi:hypothetical protein